MPSVVLDSGPAYALFDKDDRYHQRAVEFLKRAKPLDFVTNISVVTEVTFLLGARAPLFLDWVVKAVEIDTETASDLTSIAAFLRKFSDQCPDFADASLVALCERRKLSRIATVDSDFDVFRTRDGKKLRNVFLGL